jgi:hypothetical protein
MMRRLCIAAIALYPDAWLSRYGPELLILVEQRPATFLTLIDLLRGALDAHLRPISRTRTDPQRMRASISGALACWIAFVLVGGAFAKATEDAPFRVAAHAHGLLGIARTAVIVLAALSAVTVALAGAPLLVAVARQAWVDRDRALIRALLVPVAGVAAFLVTTAALALATHASLSHPAPMVPRVWAVVTVAAAAACAFGTRATLKRARFGTFELRAGTVGATVLSRAMAALTVAVAVYEVTLLVDSPRLGSLQNGPFHTSTTVVLSLLLAAMTVLSTLATRAARRARRALPDS